MGTIAEMINLGLQYIIAYATDNLVPFMAIVFLVGIALRAIIYFTVHCEAAFSLEFEKRVHKYLADPNYEHRFKSFHALTRRLLERTFEEHYELKKKLRRRRMDQLTTITDRIFMIPEGAKRLIGDTLSQTKYLHKGGKEPKFGDIARWVFESNPVFNRALGILPIAVIHDILNILPGLFVIGGIFGTFLGVMQALPMLSEMDITNIESTKAIMDGFLLKMAFSMGTSVVGIIFSVSMTMVNALLNPDGTYYSMVNKFTSALDFLWNDTSTNEVADTEKEVLSADRRQLVYSSGGPTFDNGSREQELESLPSKKDLEALTKEDSAVSDVPTDAQLEEIIQEFAVPEPIEPEVTLPDSSPDALDAAIEEEVSGEATETPSSAEAPMGPEPIAEEPSTVSTEEEADAEEIRAETLSDPIESVPEVSTLDEASPDVDFAEVEGEGMESPSMDGANEEQILLESASESEEVMHPVAQESDSEPEPEPEPEEEVRAEDDDVDLWSASEGPVDLDPDSSVLVTPPPEETHSVEGQAETESREEEPASETSPVGEDPTGLKAVFDKVDDLLGGIEPADPTEKEKELEARIEVLHHRLHVLDEYLAKADADRLTGKMSEAMWKEETARYATEKEQLQREIEELESEDKAA